MIPPIMMSDLIQALRNHFVWRCTLRVHKSHRYYTSIAGLAAATGMSMAKVRAILVSQTRDPTVPEIDAILRGLKITISDLLSFDTAISDPIPVTSSLEAHITVLLEMTDSLISLATKHIGQPHASALLAKAGRIQAAGEGIARLHGLVQMTGLDKKTLPKY